MFSYNVLKEAIRNIKNQRLYSYINIAGLSIGLAVAILLFSWINSQVNFDKFHKNASEIYLVVQHSEFEGENSEENSIQAPFAETVKNRFPEIIESCRVFYPQNRMSYSYGENSFVETFTMAVDPSFLKLFSFHLIKGNLNTALNNPSSVILTQKAASKYFGDENPMGKSILVDNKFSLNVTGIIEEAPVNSTLFFDFIIPMQSKIVTDEKILSEWSSHDDFTTYVLLDKSSNYEEVSLKLKNTLHEFIPESKATHYLFPFVKIHTSDFAEDRGINQMYIYLILIVAILILVLASINYSNLSIAGLLKRNKEIMLRKISGASRASIASRIICESFLYVLIALPVALFLCHWAVPLINQFIGNEIFQGLQFKWPIILGIVGMVFLTGIISSVYPAYIFSKKNPVVVFSQQQNKENTNFRNVLLVFQFVASIILILCTTFIYRQVHLMKSKDFGFDAQNLITVPLAMQMGEGLKGPAYETFKNELLSNPGILNVTRGLGSPMNNRANKNEVWWEGKPENQSLFVRWASVDIDYLETLGVKLFDGRFFTYEILSSMWNQEQFAFIINRETQRHMGVESAVGKAFTLGDQKGIIIGVTENFNYRTLYDKLEPLCMYFQPYFHFAMLIRLAPENTSATIKHISSTWNKFVGEYPFEYEFVLDNYQRQYELEDQTAKLLNLFGLVAIVIACLGFFGLASFSSEKRTKEIGIRKVNGAKVSEILSMLNKDFVKWVAIAFVIATPIAYYAMQAWLENFAYKTELSWWIFALAGLLALGIALLTVSWQSWRAATRNPVEALRYE
jgi:putative ABC transport system permease protein